MRDLCPGLISLPVVSSSAGAAVLEGGESLWMDVDDRKEDVHRRGCVKR